MPQAGDSVPEIEFTRVVCSPDNATWSHANFHGRMTVVVFFGNVADTTEAMFSLWNDLVDHFAERPVQFVLITRDTQEKLERWLGERDFKGWLFRDTNADTVRRWGMEWSGIAIVGANGEFLGFSRHPLPVASEIDAILAGRLRAPWLDKKPWTPDSDKPDVPPSYTVHISPTERELEQGTHGSSGATYWTRYGYQLKAILSELFGIEANRIDLPAGLESGERYDFALLLPKEESMDAIHRLVQGAMEQYFHVSITQEPRPLDVYVLTAPNGKSPALREAEFGGGGSWSLGTGWVVWNPEDGPLPDDETLRKMNACIQCLSQISATGMTIADLCRTLEPHVDRPMVDETGLDGEYDFEVRSAGVTTEDFFQALQDKVGLVLAPGRREVTRLVLRKTPR